MNASTRTLDRMARKSMRFRNKLMVRAVSSLVFLAAWAHCGNVLGQSLSIHPSAITGGGGLSTSSRFAVNGSIGQANATVTPSTGSRFAVTGGIHAWVVVIQTPDAPVLHIALDGGNITLSWANDGTSYAIEETTTLGPGVSWTTALTTSGNSAVLSMQSGIRFYRLRRIED